MSVDQFVLSSSFGRLFLSHFVCLLSYLCRSKEQRKNHREQLLSPLVMPRKQPLSTLPSHTHTHLASRTLCSLPPLILSPVGLEYITGSLVGAPTRFGWTLVQSEASVVPIPLLFAPRLLQYQHMLPLLLYFVCFNTDCKQNLKSPFGLLLPGRFREQSRILKKIQGLFPLHGLSIAIKKAWAITLPY